jgi:cyclopropane-fatty-acyl-phospholipid synthase
VWRERFWKNSDAVTQLGFDERFKRIWDFYLASCEATLGVHWTRDLQIVLTRPMNPQLSDSSL